MAIAVAGAGTFEGRRVDEAVLESGTGVSVALLNWGVTVRDWRVPVEGTLRPVVLGFETFDPYPQHSPHFGSLAGRVANRIAGARFTLDGETFTLPANLGPNTIHGGPDGLGRTVWNLEPDSAANAVRFTHKSPHGHMGFPGNLDLSATYTLSENTLTLDLFATTDRPTPLSLVQHHYFNLGTGSDVLDHAVKIPATARSAVDENLIPSGALLPVYDTQYDFRAGRTLRDASGAPVPYDVNLVLPTRRASDAPIAEVTGPDGALTLKLWSDRPGLQLYNGVTTDCPVPGLNGRRYGQYSGLCLEDQKYPGALAHAHFPSIIITPDTPYRHRCVIEIA